MHLFTINITSRCVLKRAPVDSLTSCTLASLGYIHISMYVCMCVELELEFTIACSSVDVQYTTIVQIKSNIIFYFYFQNNAEHKYV